MLEEGAARQTLEVEAPLTEAGSVAVHPGVGEAGVGRQHPQGSGGRGAGAAGLCRGGPGREEGAVGVWVAVSLWVAGLARWRGGVQLRATRWRACS